MSAAAAAADHGDHGQGGLPVAPPEHVHKGHQHAHAHEEGWIRKYFFSSDHKMISKQFLFTALLFFIIGGFMAVMVRHQLAWPGKKIFGVIPAMSDPGYYSAFTMHASIMIFAVVIPLLVGFFPNWCLPLMVGAGDMAFPRLNMFSYWVSLPAAICLVASFFVEGGAAQSGWTSYPPISEMQQHNGQNLWCMAVLFAGFSSVMGAINYITTILKMRAPGMTMFRMPLTVWALFITSILSLLATPVLASNILMLLLDRTAGTSFFMPDGIVVGPQMISGPGVLPEDVGGSLVRAGGGQVILFQHIFWFYSHPAVYIMVLPTMGITSDILSTFARKPIFGYKPMVYSMAAITGLGFIVWAHHMFQAGMNPYLALGFMVSTMFIALPSAIKVFNWLGTIWRGQIHYEVPMLFALAFVGMFIIGGLSGIFMAATPVDIHIHDTYFIVAHFHYVVFASSITAVFGAIYFWFPKMFGRMMNPTLGKIHFWGHLIFLNGTFMLMHYIGAQGFPRRYKIGYDPGSVNNTDVAWNYLQDFHWANVVMSVSAILLGVAQIPFLINLFHSMWKGKKASDNPWKANTLDWSAPTPPPHGNFATTPVVYRGPYEYSHPQCADDYLPQWEKSPIQTDSGH
jgi:cytochrome c oxidase subunit I